MSDPLPGCRESVIISYQYVFFFDRVTVTVQRENGTRNFEKKPGELKKVTNSLQN